MITEFGRSLCKLLCMDECWIIDDSAEGYKNGVWVDKWMESFALIGPWEQLRLLFYKFDEEGFGEMSSDHLRAVLYEPEFRQAIVALAGLQSLRRLEFRTLNPATITFQEFNDLLSNKRRRSLLVAVHEKDQEVVSEHNFKLDPPLPPKEAMVHKIAEEFLPDPLDRKYYEDQYSCCPPPLFMLFITVVELSSFAYYALLSGEVTPNGPVPVDSIFIYRPDKRLELWRFLLYMVLHAGWVHLCFNLVVQLLVGLPLEMVHGSFRIAMVYIAGVLAGSLGTSIFDTDVYLVGASGGVYALLAAHLANVLLNYWNMQCGLFRLLCVFIIASADVGFAVWDRYASVSSTMSNAQPVSYVAHLAGALAGLTIGLVVLKNFEQRLHDQCVWWTALLIFLGCMLFAIVWNILVY